MDVVATPSGLSTVHPATQKLVTSLSSAGDDAALVKSLKSIYTLGKNGKNRQQLFMAGAPAKLIELCTSENPSVTENAARSLLSLAEGAENINIIGYEGMDTFLANVQVQNSDIVINACKLLAKLAQTPENRRLINLRGGLAPLVDCLKRGEWIVLYATKALMSAYVDDPMTLQAALQENGVAQVYAHNRAHIESTSIPMDI